MSQPKRTALIAGGTGLIGSHLVEILASHDSYSRIILLTRNNAGVTRDKIEERIVDFGDLESGLKGLTADDVFCCLGTTMKRAGSREAFRKVDYDFVVRLATLMQKNGARQFLVVSALGSDTQSSVYYNRAKGEMELAVKDIPFPVIQIFRPSLLLGKRKEKRAGVKLAQALFRVFEFLMIGSLKRYRAIRSEVVARAMVRIALSPGDGVFIYESEMIRKI